MHLTITQIKTSKNLSIHTVKGRSITIILYYMMPCAASLWVKFKRVVDTRWLYVNRSDPKLKSNQTNFKLAENWVLFVDICLNKVVFKSCRPWLNAQHVELLCLTDWCWPCCRDQWLGIVKNGHHLEQAREVAEWVAVRGELSSSYSCYSLIFPLSATDPLTTRSWCLRETQWSRTGGELVVASHCWQGFFFFFFNTRKLDR